MLYTLNVNGMQMRWHEDAAGDHHGHDHGDDDDHGQVMTHCEDHGDCVVHADVNGADVDGR